MAFTIAKIHISLTTKNKRQIDLDVAEESGVQIVNHLMNEEDAFAVHQFLHSMKEPYKEVFSLRTFGELPFEKIGLLLEKVQAGQG